MFTDVGWAMAMTDPICYSNHLGSSIDSSTLDAHDVAPPKVVVRNLRYKNRARPTVLRNTGTRGLDSLPGAVRDTAGHSVARTRQTTECVSRHFLTSPDTSRQGRSISS
jgi:hypothetical protein